MQLVIVESPAKAKKINAYLGPDYKVLASFGHVRDLPPKDKSVLPDEDFAMRWESSSKSAKHMKAIVDAAKKSDRLVLATDPDREGEAIAWHVLEELSSKRGVLKDKPVERVAFNAITKQAVQDAIQNPRQINQELVDAYLARRALDYLVGFTLSPILWRKLPGSRSAGRVQSVALRLIVAREMEVELFNPREYWSIEALIKSQDGTEFSARLYSLDDGKPLGKFALGDAGTAQKALDRVKASAFRVLEIETKPAQKHPPAPFTTSTLQQEAARKLGLDARSSMQAAQKLYEAGHITYMRTDGVQMAPEAYTQARNVISQEFGKPYLPKAVRRYSSKAKNAQEAHEAVRPTRFDLGPGQAGGNKAEAGLYDLIWKRAVASQMESALFERTRIDLEDETGKIILRATGQIVRFDGFLRLYEEGQDDAEEEASARLPDLKRGQAVDIKKAQKKEHKTEPPPRYTESSLVKKMEELGIGRPSTYASTLSTLRDREYVSMDRKRFVPEDTGRLVTLFLEQFFGPVIAYDFTAGLEEKLDMVSDGKLGWKTFLAEFWREFNAQINNASELTRSEVIDALDAVLTLYLFPDAKAGEDPRICTKCQGGRLGLKLSRHGAFIGCSNYPECQHTRPFGKGGDEAERAWAEENPVLGSHPETGQPVYLKNGRFGAYVEMEGDADKPKRSSIPKSWDGLEIDLTKAVQLLSLPRTIGLHPDDKEAINASIGRYGPYVVHGKTYVNLDSVEDVFEVGLNRAVSLIADKRANAGRRGGAAPLRELGAHPETGDMVQVMDGRYGPYVKLGRVNATLPRGVEPETVSLDQALELIAAKAGKAKPKAKAKAKPRASRKSS